MKSGALSHEYKAMAEGCGISGMRFYNLRLTHASLLLTSNIPIQVVQARIGNESIQTTVGTYGHVLAGSDVEGEKGDVESAGCSVRKMFA